MVQRNADNRRGRGGGARTVVLRPSQAVAVSFVVLRGIEDWIALNLF
jgi:hypothetical protein